jgi:signal transduction histidine kinase
MNSQEPPVQKESILIVDDNPANLRLLSQMLAKQGYKVRAVISGARALEAVQANPPDLVLLDILMPEMSGYQVCEHLKADETTRDIPIIFISALDATEDKIQAFTAGGVDYITKPFQAKEVVARIETHMALRNLQKQLQEKNVQLEQEITERKQAEVTLRQRTLELEAHNAELDAFSHTVAHDLKNPLNLIAGYSDVLVYDYASLSDEDLREYIQAISVGSRKMHNIIEELMLLAGLRKTEVEMVPLDMAGIVAEARTRLVSTVEEHQVEMILPEIWPVALGYGPWVEEIWVNYISNAIKYGGQPPRVEVGATEQEAGTVRFWVRDNGPGMAPEEQARLFTPFERLNQVRVEGHGLGLSIVLRIVGKLGGQVGVESEVGQGSTFFFTLPSA